MEPAPLKKGELVADRFVVDSMVGMGGMGAVYRARDLQLDGLAALKVIAQPLRSGDDRFAREALVLAELSHPSIVRYLMHGSTSSGTPFLAMEWLDGEDLSVRLRRAGLKVEESLELFRRVCTGLAAAHEKAVIHRDIKPSNIFLVGGAAACAKVLDFGVARYAAATRTLTRAGSLVGTIGYMAPEQATGAPELDARADVFALGCVLFECLTGQPAFSAQHEVAVLAKVLRDDPPRISELRPGLGSALDMFVARLLAKDRTQRPADAAAVLRELEGLDELRGEVPLALTSRSPSRLVESEQRIVTVILAHAVKTFARTLPLAEAEQQATGLDELCWQFRAEQVVLQTGGLLLVLGATTGVTASDQAAQAARCALCLRELRPELVLALATGSADTASRIPMGSAIDRAAALLAKSDDSEPCIALDKLTAGLLGARFDVQRVGGQLSLVSEIEALEAPRLLVGRRTPCVGRDKELALLDATLEECASDEVARVVLVTAPPGVGKSRLGQEFIEQTRAKGAAKIMTARAEPNAAGSALRIVRRLLRGAAGLLDGGPAAAQQPLLRDYLASLLQAAALERAVEFIGELLGMQVDEPSPLLRAARNDPEIMREQTRRAFESWIDAESARRPLLLFLDDLHWADPSSVAYIDELLQMWSRRRILVVALARPEVHQRFPKLWQAAGVQEIRLGGLTRRAAERLVKAVLSPDQQAPIASRIIELADGNAFFLEELIRRAAEGGTEFPETVLAIVQSRLDGLALEERRVLRAASVFGETLWAGGVDALLGSDDAHAWLDSLVNREILVRRSQARFPGEREYSFRHAFLRDAAYAMLPPADQRVAHGMAGDWLEQAGESDARLLADHYERSDIPARAVSWLVRAALAALESGDIDGARQLSNHGLLLGAAGSERGLLLLVAEYMSAWSGTADVRRLREAIELLPESSAHWWLAVSTLIFCASSEDAALVAPYLQLAQERPPGQELTGFRGLALQSMASATILVGRTDIGRSLLTRFEELTLEDGRCDQIFVTRFKIAWTHLAVYSPINGKWQLQKALDWGRESTASMDAAGSASGEMTALFILGCAWLFLGAYAQAQATLLKSVQNAKRSGNVLVESYSQLVLAWVTLRRGRVDEARGLLGHVMHSRDANLVHGVRAVQAEAAYRSGLLADALEQALAATHGPTAPYRRLASATAARAHLALGQAQQAVARVDAAFQDGNVAPNLEFEVDLRITRARALAQLGDAQRAQAELREANDFMLDAASSIEESALREGFLDNVEAHRWLREHLAGAAV